METKAPVLDDRKSVDIYRQSLALARFYCPEWAEKWQNDFDPEDPGLVMLKLFSKMTEHLLIQLNRIPEKHRIAFLDFMGVEPLSAQPAKVPVTFYLARGASGAYVPEGALVASKDPEVIFETTKGLSVAPAELGAVFTLDPLNDSYTDHSRDVKEKEDAFSIFGEKGELNLDHVLYLGDETLLDIRRPPETLEITFEGNNLNKKYFDQFYYDNDKILGEIELSSDNSPITASIKKIQSLKRLTIDNYESFWLRVQPEGNLKFLRPFYWDEIVEKDEIRFKEFILNTNGPGWVEQSKIEKIDDEIIISSSADKNSEDYNKSISITKHETKDKIDFSVKSTDVWISSIPGIIEGGRVILDPLPQISKITVHITVADILPEMAFFNNTPVDMKKGFYPFGEMPKAGDALYIGSDEAFSKKGSTITLTLDLKKALVSDNIKVGLNWEYWDGTKWSTMGKSDEVTSKIGSFFYEENGKSIPIIFNDYTNAFKQDGSHDISFTCPPVGKTEINGQPNRWIRVRIDTGGYGEEGKYEPDWKDIDTIIEGLKNKDDNLERFKVKLKEFKIDDSVIEKICDYLELKPNADLPNFRKKIDESNHEIEAIEKILPGLKPEINALNELKKKLESENFDKIVKFFKFQEEDKIKDLIDKLWAGKSTIGNAEDALNLIESEDKALEEVKQKLKEKYKFGFKYIEPTLNPPFIKSLKIKYEYSGATFKQIKTYNNFNFDPQVVEKFNPYKLLPDNTPSMYLGFVDEKIAGSSLSLYFAIKEKLYGQENNKSIKIPEISDEDTGFKWEYHDGRDWKVFNVDDETNSFTIGGIISFQVPSDIKAKDEFNKNLFWIRITPKNPKQLVFPELKGISPNTMWAENSATVNDEILGSGNGIPNLSLSFSKNPILEGQVIEVNEAGILSKDEKKVIETEEGKDSIREVKDAKTGEVNEVWVRWHEVKNFSLSVQLSRHYVLDRLNGRIYFGDGVRGMVPPKGKNNIVARIYKSGGGKAGNLAPGKITALKRKIPNIESVINHVSSSGGRDQENLPAAISRGPHSLKNRNRAVTKEDYEWLAYEASQDVAKAKCILAPSRNINILIVPESSEAAPFPDAGLIDTVEKYLKERALLSIRGELIEVVGPEYETINIDLTFKIIQDLASEYNMVNEKIKERLRTFLHPLKGGQNGEGWDFGQGIFISEVAAVVEAIEGVDYITEITLTKEEKDQKYLFESAIIQETDKQKIREFLIDDLDVSWVVNADIALNQNNVYITKGEKSVQINEIDHTLKVSINDGQEYTLKFLTESIRIALTGVGYLPLRKIALPTPGEINIWSENASTTT
jgi:hypothetical protein